MSLFYYFFRTGLSLEKAKYRQMHEDVRKHFSHNEIEKKGFAGQHGQDMFAMTYFKNKKEGFFVDIGANDGISLSNSYVLEKKYNWDGLCVEPLPNEFQKLKSIRTCKLEQKCIGEKIGKAKFLMHDMLSGIVEAYHKKHLNRIARDEKQAGKKVERKYLTVDVVPLKNLLEKYKVKKVDFLSIDVEGGEKVVLNGIDLRQSNVQLIAIENNYKDIEIYKKIVSQGYRLIAVLGCDEMYEQIFKK